MQPNDFFTGLNKSEHSESDTESRSNSLDFGPEVHGDSPLDPNQAFFEAD